MYSLYTDNALAITFYILHNRQSKILFINFYIKIKWKIYDNLGIRIVIWFHQIILNKNLTDFPCSMLLLDMARVQKHFSSLN